MFSFTWVPSAMLSFLITIIAIYLLKYQAMRWGWVDEPNHRKRHQNRIPLVGGVGMFSALALTISMTHFSISPFIGLLAGMLIVVITGVYDDFHDSSARTRFLAQIIATLIFVFCDGVVLSDLGTLFNQQIIYLDFWSIPFTVFCVVGVINAINMSDGVDGLAGGFGIIAALWLIILLLLSGEYRPELYLLILLAAAISGFLCFNLRCPWRRRASVFMGDSGSMMIGLVLAWLFIRLSQGEQAIFSPISAVWIIALPLMDTVSVMIRRMFHGRSPFQPDRHHLHHLLQRMGYSEANTTALLLIVSLMFGGIAVIGSYLAIPDYLLFFGFVGLFALYLITVYWAWGMSQRVEHDNVQPSINQDQCDSEAVNHARGL